MEEMNFDYSAVTLPGVGGSLNAATAMSVDKLEELNKAGKKWRIDEEGGMSFHNESLLKANQNSRSRRENLVNRSLQEVASGEVAMKEIFGRKKSRMAAFQEVKRGEYNFADDSELMSMPQPFAHAECCGSKDCNCRSCKKARMKEEQDFREWSSKRRKELNEGTVKGEFAGPGMSFPIASPEDVSAAWSSVGRAANPRKVMAEIIRIAKKFDWESGLPQTVKDRLKAGESGLPSPDFREWPTAKRKQLKEGSIKGEFAGPGVSFPIASPKDVSAAWSSSGRADNPRKVMAEVIRIAKENGWESGLPETVQDRLKAGQSGLP